MNYTNANDLNHEDSPKDWLNSALIFASALGHILREKEGVVIDIEGDMDLPDFEAIGSKKVIVYASKDQVHVTECLDDILAGTLVWMHDTEWHCQYLENEKMWYLTEHGDDGIDGEHFFDTKEELDEYLEDNDITLSFNEGEKV